MGNSLREKMGLDKKRKEAAKAAAVALPPAKEQAVAAKVQKPIAPLPKEPPQQVKKDKPKKDKKPSADKPAQTVLHVCGHTANNRPCPQCLDDTRKQRGEAYRARLAAKHKEWEGNRLPHGSFFAPFRYDAAIKRWRGELWIPYRIEGDPTVSWQIFSQDSGGVMKLPPKLDGQYRHWLTGLGSKLALGWPDGCPLPDVGVTVDPVGMPCAPPTASPIHEPVVLSKEGALAWEQAAAKTKQPINDLSIGSPSPILAAVCPVNLDPAEQKVWLFLAQNGPATAQQIGKAVGMDNAYFGQFLMKIINKKAIECKEGKYQIGDAGMKALTSVAFDPLSNQGVKP